jgi:hypothetical protein
VRARATQCLGLRLSEPSCAVTCAHIREKASLLFSNFFCNTALAAWPWGASTFEAWGLALAPACFYSPPSAAETGVPRCGHIALLLRHAAEGMDREIATHAQPRHNRDRGTPEIATHTTGTPGTGTAVASTIAPLPHRVQLPQLTLQTCMRATSTPRRRARPHVPSLAHDSRISHRAPCPATLLTVRRSRSRRPPWPRPHSADAAFIQLLATWSVIGHGRARE